MRISLLLLMMCVHMSVGALVLPQNNIESLILVHSYIQKEGGQLVPDESRITGLVNEGGSYSVLEEKTWVIPNKLGTGFEIAVGFKGIPEDLKRFDLSIKFPEMTLPSGEVKTELNRPIELGGHDGTYLWYFSFFFDFPYETSAGDWNIEIRAQGDAIHNSTFSVVEYDGLEHK